MNRDPLTDALATMLSEAGKLVMALAVIPCAVVVIAMAVGGQ